MAEIAMVWGCPRSYHESPFLGLVLFYVDDVFSTIHIVFSLSHALTPLFLSLHFSRSPPPPMSALPPPTSCLSKRPKKWLISDLLIVGKAKPFVNGNDLKPISGVLG